MLSLSPGFRGTFGKYTVSTAPHCYAIPMGKMIPSSPSALRDLEITDGLTGHGGSIDPFLDALNRVTGIEVTADFVGFFLGGGFQGRWF